jgi:hypothetical protein
MAVLFEEGACELQERKTSMTKKVTIDFITGFYG